jgi:hypothetical protein
MQKNWYNQCKLIAKKIIFYAYLSLILSSLNHFLCIFEFDFELVKSLFLHLKINWITFSAYLSLILTKSFRFFNFEFDLVTQEFTQMQQSQKKNG